MIRLLGEAYSTTIQDSDPRLQDLKPPFEIQIRNKAKEVLVEDELARRR
jgi:DnaJ family protein C protein 8